MAQRKKNLIKKDEILGRRKKKCMENICLLEVTWIFEVIKFKINLEIKFWVFSKTNEPTQKIKKMTSTNLAFEPIDCCI